ncbi:MAG: Precorrin-3B methylase [Cyanobacteria bacterium Co-bin13]|nr:Precorrin-3B methylase [Cyanobacteria bacterium Co-bin13]
MPTPDRPLEGDELIKEVCRRIRAARSLWDAHKNAACRQEREQALALYNTLTPEQKDKVPQVLRVWLRYRSEKYFGPHQTQPGSSDRSSKRSSQRRSQKKHP